MNPPRDVLMDASICTPWHTLSQHDWILRSKDSRFSEAYAQTCSQIHSQLHSITHSQLAWYMLPNSLSRPSQVHSKYAPSTLSTFLSTLLGMLSRMLAIALDGTLPACLTVRSKVSSQDALKHTLSTHPRMFPCTPLSSFSCTHPGMLYRRLPIALHGALHACFTVYSQASSQDTVMHTPSMFQVLLPGMLWRMLPITLNGTLPAYLALCSHFHSTICFHVHSCKLNPETCWVVDTRHWKVKLEVPGAKRGELQAPCTGR